MLPLTQLLKLMILTIRSGNESVANEPHFSVFAECSRRLANRPRFNFSFFSPCGVFG